MTEFNQKLRPGTWWGPVWGSRSWWTSPCSVPATGQSWWPDSAVPLPTPHLARQTEQVELHRLADVADLVPQCSIAGHHMWTWHEYDLTLNFVIRTLPSDLWTAPSWHQRPGTHPCPSLTGLDVIIIWLIDHWHIYKKIFMSANWWHNLVTCEDVTVVVVHLDIRLGTHSVSAEDRDCLPNYDIMGN